MRSPNTEPTPTVTPEARDQQAARALESDTRSNTRWTVPIAIGMIVLGIVAIFTPLFATIVSALVFGWIFVFAGVAQIIYAFRSKSAGQIVWKLILGFLYLVAGFFVLASPLGGAIALTFVLGITIFVQGIIQVIMAFQIRRASRNWGWILISGIIGIIFGIVVFSSFPAIAAWLLGTLLGVNLLFDGIWMLTPHASTAYPSGLDTLQNIQTDERN